MASARAMPTRCFMPPESWCGRRFCEAVRPTSSRYFSAVSRSVCAAHALHLQAEHHVLQGGEPGQQFGVLEHHAAVVAAAVHLAAVDGDAAADRRVEPHGDAQRRGLAAAGRADQRDDLAVAHGEADAVERLHVMQLAVHAQREALGHVEETHLTHSAGSAALRASVAGRYQLQRLFPRYSGAVTF